MKSHSAMKIYHVNRAYFAKKLCIKILCAWLLDEKPTNYKIHIYIFGRQWILLNKLNRKTYVETLYRTEGLHDRTAVKIAKWAKLLSETNSKRRSFKLANFLAPIRLVNLSNAGEEILCWESGIKCIHIHLFIFINIEK